MEQLVRVQKCNDDGTAQVIYLRQSACSGDCHKCSGCGATQQTMVFTAKNLIGARAGQVVFVQSASGPVLLAAAVLYLLPLAMFFLGYFVFACLWEKGALGGLLSFAAGIVLAALYDRFVAKKQKSVYTITRFADGSVQFSEKGDNNID